MMQNQISPVVVQPSNVGRNKRYHLQGGVCLGIFIVLLAVCMVVLKLTISTYWMLPYYSPVFWGSAMFSIAGTLTIAGGCNNSNCIVISAIVMCIASMVFGGLGTVIESAIFLSNLQDFVLICFSSPCQRTEEIVYWMTVALMIAAIVESILAIVVSAMSCYRSCDSCYQNDNKSIVLQNRANHNRGLTGPGHNGYEGNDPAPTGGTAGYPPPPRGGQTADYRAPSPDDDDYTYIDL